MGNVLTDWALLDIHVHVQERCSNFETHQRLLLILVLQSKVVPFQNFQLPEHLVENYLTDGFFLCAYIWGVCAYMGCVCAYMGCVCIYGVWMLYTDQGRAKQTVNIVSGNS